MAATIPGGALAALTLVALVSGGISCQLIADGSIAAGIGESCKIDDECHASKCVSGVCSLQCSTQVDCPAGSECAGGLCQVPLSVGFIYVGAPQDEGWTLTHDIGRQYAESKLPYLRTDFVTNTLAEDLPAAVNKFVKSGASVIVANSFSHRDGMAAEAGRNPGVQFLTCSSNVTGTNLGSYFARSYQTWYLAGYAAAQKSTVKRLGFVGSLVTPEVVRHINAFTRGAKRIDDSIVVEVRWLGFWFDLEPDQVTGKFDEEQLTEQLIQTGCDVIAHGSDTGRTVAVVEKHHSMGMSVFSIGNDNQDACKKGPTSCIGVPYWNWGPLYEHMFDDIHKKRWNPNVPINENVKVDPQKSIISFGVNTDLEGGSNINISVSERLSELATDQGVSIPFQGPYCSTGQRAECVKDGESISDAELATMCWFVDGVVERENPDPSVQSKDKPAQVPDGTVPVPSFPLGSTQTPDCRLNR